ncbi:MAG: hypothetical protein IPH35_11315 [Rhodoferax sp.]|nr:hypothetical protein [Rhodoferax sp.]
MSNGFFMVYEEPHTLFGEDDWLRFRDEMREEVRLHPDWEEAASALRMAEDHLKWIKENAPRFALPLAA